MTRWRVDPATLLACVALAVAVFMPRLALRRELPNVIAIIDITQSMNVADQSLDGRSVSRLDFVKHALRSALPRLPCGSRVGLGVFTHYRSLVLFDPVEVCANAAELGDTIDHVNGQMAWAGGSEISKGLQLTAKMLRPLDPAPAFVFFTDGQEAPPINPAHRLDLTADAGGVQGLLVGVGGSIPQPIPKMDPEGNAAGVWAANEVMQQDLYANAGHDDSDDHTVYDVGPNVPVGPAA